MRFEFATAGRIIFGNDTFKEAGPAAAKAASKVLVVTDRNIASAKELHGQLEEEDLQYVTYYCDGEPTTESAMASAEEARNSGCDGVIGLGGGSVIDTGKVAATMLTNTGELMDYLEVVGRGEPVKKRPAPYIAIPTTAGTGAEVTRNAVLGVPEHGVKVSMRSALMLPAISLVDPVLTYSMPGSVTASTGLDALTQLMEVFVSNKANALTDGICREGLVRAARSLRKAYENGSDVKAREDMSLASLFGGLALANAKLGAVHGFAGPLGGMIHAPHGVICAALLPYVMETNVRALQERDAESAALGRYEEIARILTGSGSVKAGDGVAWVQEICKALEVPGLSQFGLKREAFVEAVHKAKNASSMKGNPIMLTEDELLEILNRGYG
ncbi:MAG: iron-containing alcohol dehydrogenase [Planctomycetota bacterium]|jgi:alcohol dehydrogenase class IV